MAKMDIALELGTSFTSIYVSGNGIVLHEPSVIAYYDGGSKRSMRAVGDAAYRMIGKTPDRIKTVCPIIDGVIKDQDAATTMLGEFIKKVLPASYLVKPRIRAVLGVPTGLSVQERKMYEEVLMGSGVDEVTMVNSIMLAAIGCELPVSSDYGGFIVSIGGGVTEIAALSLSGIVTGCSINIGGDMIDRTLLDSIRGLYNRLKTDIATVRAAKEKIASLIRNDRATVTISGIDQDTKKIRTEEISSDKVYGAVSVYYNNIIDAVDSVINSSSPTLAAEIRKNGIHVVGGSANIPGLAELMSERLGVNVKVPRDPQYAAVLGAGMLLSDPYLLNDILMHA